MSAVLELDAGEKAKVTATFRNAAGVLADPSTVIFKARNPATGVSTPYQSGVASEVTHPSTGVYEFTWTVSPAGKWRVEVVTTGDPQVVEHLYVLAYPSEQD